MSGITRCLYHSRNPQLTYGTPKDIIHCQTLTALPEPHTFLSLRDSKFFTDLDLSFSHAQDASRMYITMST